MKQTKIYIVSLIFAIYLNCSTATTTTSSLADNSKTLNQPTQNGIVSDKSTPSINEPNGAHSDLTPGSLTTNASTNQTSSSEPTQDAINTPVQASQNESTTIQESKKTTENLINASTNTQIPSTSDDVSNAQTVSSTTHSVSITGASQQNVSGTTQLPQSVSSTESQHSVSTAEAHNIPTTSQAPQSMNVTSQASDNVSDTPQTQHNVSGAPHSQHIVSGTSHAPKNVSDTSQSPLNVSDTSQSPLNVSDTSQSPLSVSDATDVYNVSDTLDSTSHIPQSLNVTSELEYQTLSTLPPETTIPAPGNITITDATVAEYDSITTSFVQELPITKDSTGTTLTTESFEDIFEEILEDIEPDVENINPIFEGNGTFEQPYNASKTEADETPSMYSIILITSLCFGVVFFIVVIVLVTRRVYDGWKKRHYSRIDYLVNGMYN